MLDSSGWIQVATFTKHNRKGKLRDTFRVYTNELCWCKGRSDQSGRDFLFNSHFALSTKATQLVDSGYELASGELPLRVVGQYSTSADYV